MADQDRDGPSLELPSFGFRRKRRKDDRADEAASAPQPEPTPEPEPAPGPAPAPEPAVVDDPEPTPEPAPPSEPAPEPGEGAPAQPRRPFRLRRKQARASAAAQAEPEPATEPIPAAADEAPDETVVTREAERPLFADETPTTATTVVPPEERVEPEPEVREQKPRRTLRLPIGTIPGAILTGILVGAATVGLTWGALQICEIVRGASSCGGTGLWLLLLILVAMIFLGAGLLRFFDVGDAGSTSFLAVGLLAVVVMLFLVDLLFNWWMIIVIPAVTLLTYTLSAWVTSSFVDSGRG